MTRERIRRSCGHLEAVYAIGFGVGRIHQKEREFCRICRERRNSESPSDIVVVTPEEDDRKSSTPPDSSGKPGTFHSERKQFRDTGDSRC